MIHELPSHQQVLWMVWVQICHSLFYAAMTEVWPETRTCEGESRVMVIIITTYCGMKEAKPIKRNQSWLCPVGNPHPLFPPYCISFCVHGESGLVTRKDQWLQLHSDSSSSSTVVVRAAAVKNPPVVGHDMKLRYYPPKKTFFQGPFIESLSY